MAKSRNAIIAIVAAVLLVFGGSQAAYADSSNNFNHGGALRAQVSYASYGDRITVKDSKADGYWIRAELSWKGSGVKTCDLKTGNGTTTSCRFNAPEGAAITYKAYLMKGNTYYQGSPIWRDKA